MTVSIAVLASGRGSNFEAIQAAITGGVLDARIAAVISDRADAPVLEKARAAGVPFFAVPRNQLSREAHEDAILSVLKPLAPRFLVLAGYMRLLGPRLLQAFMSERGYFRVVNVHPSLLPAFPGASGYEQAFVHGAQVAGVTVHLVDETLDGGPICVQEAFSISDCRTVAEVEARGLALEHRAFPRALGWILPERFTIEVCSGNQSCRRIRVRQN